MTTHASQTHKLRVVIVGGGVAAVETALGLAHLAPEQTDVTLLAPNAEFVYRPMTVREPFAYPRARRYPLQRIATDTGATLVADALSFIDPDKQMIHTQGDVEIEYDALVLALGAKAHRRYEHALTIDDRRLDETMHGLIQDIEGGYTKSVAFVSPGRMAWPLPLYELALMTAGRAYDMGVDLETTIVTPEERPLAIFGSRASDAVSAALGRAGVSIMTSAYAEIPKDGEIVVNPGERRLDAGRIVALPDLFGPDLRGIPLGEHGFIRVDPHGKVCDVENIYAAGDAIEFPVKHGGLASQQADVVAQSIAALAGSGVTPEPFVPVIHGMLLTDDKPLYLTAHIAGGRGSDASSQVSDTPGWAPGSKIAARYLAPYLEELDRQNTGGPVPHDSAQETRAQSEHTGMRT
jgi:sulfide:quinone oxidoreductase